MKYGILEDEYEYETLKDEFGIRENEYRTNVVYIYHWKQKGKRKEGEKNINLLVWNGIDLLWQ